MSCLRTRIATTATMLMRRPRLAVAFRHQQRLHRILMRSWPRFMRRATSDISVSDQSHQPGQLLSAPTLRLIQGQQSTSSALLGGEVSEQEVNPPPPPPLQTLQTPSWLNDAETIVQNTPRSSSADAQEPKDWLQKTPTQMISDAIDADEKGEASATPVVPLPIQVPSDASSPPPLLHTCSAVL